MESIIALADNFDPLTAILLMGVYWRIDRRLLQLEKHPAIDLKGN